MLKVSMPERLRENGIVEFGWKAGRIRVSGIEVTTTASTTTSSPTGCIIALVSVEHRGLKLKEIFARQLLDEVGGHQTTTAVEQLSVVEAVLVDAPKNEDKVATDEGHLGVRILIR